MRYQFFEADQLLIQKYSGEFILDRYMQYSGFIMQRFASKPVKKVLIDFRDILFDEIEKVDPSIFFNTLNRVIEARKNLPNVPSGMNDILHVFWVNKPMPTVIVELFVQSFPDRDYKFCSSIQKVFEIIKVGESIHQLEQMVEHLENHF